ncbi:MAG: uncharacterized membrane protein YjfL (UPF0719 family) [Alphaproteobacteria bacterium]|jgi:uncharacterized membrane protein YjfL (UPF0719 family)
MELLNSLNIDAHYAIILLINLAIAFGLLTAVKFISGVISNVNAINELAEKDNTAFGVSVACVALAVTIIMTGVMSGEASYSILLEAMNVFGYGALGLVLMIVTRAIFDRISMPNFSVKNEILKGNIAAAIVDGGNVIATAIIIRAALIWIEHNTIYDGLLVLGAYCLSQIILTIASKYRIYMYKSQQNGETLQCAIQNGNKALAWRFSGYRIGIALAISAASGIVPYDLNAPISMAFMWVAVSFVMMIFMLMMVFIADKIILHKINLNQEINDQQNSAVGIIQAAIIISTGLIIATLTA